MNSQPMISSRGFTLVELMISLSLSLMVLTAVFSSYLFLARNFTRQLGVSSANQPTLQAQAARTIVLFEQDVKMARGILGTPSASQLTLVVSTSAGPKNIYYYFNDTASAVSPLLGGENETIAAHTLLRKDSGTGAVQAIHSSLLTCRFSYYDQSGGIFAILDSTTVGYSSLQGIKEVALQFTSQSGSLTNGTMTPVYSYATPRVVMRNKLFLP